MLASGGLLFAAETYLAETRFFRDPGDWGAVGALWETFHWLIEVLGIFAGLAVAVLAVPAFLGLNWARAVIWVFGLPMLIWYAVTAFLAGLGRLMGGGGSGTGGLDTALTTTAAVLLIGALIGQTVPASDAYFRRALREKV